MKIDTIILPLEVIPSHYILFSCGNNDMIEAQLSKVGMTFMALKYCV
jgi:hypothetical protein